MDDKGFLQDPIHRRDFLRRGGIVGLGLTLDASSRASASGMMAFGSERGPASVPGSAIADLRAKLSRSNVLTPDDSAYARTGLPQNGMYLTVRPGAIALCENVGDVVICVKWCNKHGISPVVRGGGHSYAGLSTTTGLLIDLGRLNKVTVEAGSGTAVVGGAALNRDVRDATRGGAYFLPGGTCLGVGVGGLVLGGGIGYNSRWAGLTCDSLVSTRIVTASGEVLDAGADTNSDLFWACRGGAGGSFGINTSFTFRLRKVPVAKVTYFLLELEGADHAFDVFAEFNRLMATGEWRLNAVARARAIKVGAGGGRRAIHVRSRGQFIGSEAELKGLLSSYPTLARHSTMQEMEFWDAAKIFTDEPQPPHSFADISRYAREPVSDESIRKQVELLVKCPGRSDDPAGPSGSMWSLGWVGGEVMNGVGRTDTAYVHRGMSTLLRPTCSWPNGADAVGEELRSWTKELVAAVAPETPNESYQNFPNRLIADWPQQYYAENLGRLIEVKGKYDGNNLFHNAQSIPPNPI